MKRKKTQQVGRKEAQKSQEQTILSFFCVSCAFLRPFRKQFSILWVVAMLAWTGLALGAVSVQEVAQTNGVMHLLVTNEYFEMELAPESGASACSFKTRHGTNNWVFPHYGGMFRECFVGTGFPYSELLWNKRAYTIPEKGPEKVVIEFQTGTKEMIRLIRKITFTSGSPTIRVTLSMINEGPQSAVYALWPDFMIYVSGIQENNRYFRPNIRGISETGWDEKSKKNLGEDYERNPFAGWTASLNTATGEGLVWLMDYNWLKLLYNCNSAWTVEWAYDYATLPKQGKWETEYDIILTKGFPGFCHASTNLIAGMTMEPKGEVLAITHMLGRSLTGDLKDVKIAAKLRGVDSKEEHDLPALTFGDLSWEPKTQAQTIKVKMDQRLVCDVTLSGVSSEGKPVQENYSYYWPGSKGEGFDLMAGKAGTTYRRKAPKKVKEFLKPKDLVYYRKPAPRMLEMRGSFYHYFRVPEAAVKAGVSVIADSYFVINFGGTSLTDVPGSYEEMFKNDLLVLNNVTAQSLTDFGQDALREFVKAGGSVLVLGGQFAFGSGGYRDTVLAEILPVEINENPFDLRQLDPPGKLKVASTARVLKGLKLRDKSYCFWRNEVKPKTEAWVELTAGDIPFLVCGRYGQGKVAVVAGTVCGEPAGREKAFWESEDWPDILSSVIRWMVWENPPEGSN